jgi:hypothetical protein
MLTKIKYVSRVWDISQREDGFLLASGERRLLAKPDGTGWECTRDAEPAPTLLMDNKPDPARDEAAILERMEKTGAQQIELVKQRAVVAFLEAQPRPQSIYERILAG